MRLDRLLEEVEVLHLRGDPATEVEAVTHDTASVRPGSLFCCVPGARVDGHDLARSAVAAGAAALLCERTLPLDVAQAVVARTRLALGPLAATFFGQPSRRLAVVGITGTNGKTTTAHLLAAVLAAGGRPTEVIGTVSGVRTTPEAPELQARLARAVEKGAQAVALEVSSHALVQHRVDATWFTVAVFTNLSPEHLDYHASMEEYFAAKATLFDPARAGVAVIDVDDPYGRRLAETSALPVVRCSIADAAELELGPTASAFRWEGEPVRLALGGPFNVRNALAAAAAARELGVDAAAVAAGLSSVSSVPGRFELVDAGQPFLAVVDYAHTPASLDQLLVAARHARPGGRVVVVFGCGGDRDRAKRPAMGSVASRRADVVVLTSDNPRHEDPQAIIDEVRAGLVPGAEAVIEPDRRAAIALAVATAGPGDVVVVAGKGHETVQVVGERDEPFDDRTVLAEELARHRVAGVRGPAW